METTCVGWPMSPFQVNDRPEMAFALPPLTTGGLSYIRGLGEEPCPQDTALERESVLFTMETTPPGCAGMRFIL